MLAPRLLLEFSLRYKAINQFRRGVRVLAPRRYQREREERREEDDREIPGGIWVIYK